nr:hypothetical protein [uncultured Flavobacterium sp.]
MKKFKQISLFVLILLLCNYIYSQNDATVATTELKRMNEMFGYGVKMNVKDKGQIVSLPNQVIELSLDELKRISPITEKNIRFYIVRFVVAHEFAHQIQYYRFGNNPKFMNNDLVSKTLIEAQADILAGSIFLMISPELQVYKETKPEFFKKIFNELFKVTYNMGISEYTLGSHPSKRDRMLAARLGFTNGFTMVYDNWVKMDTVRAIQSGITHEIFKKQMKDQFRFIDLKDNEDILLWSYRQAKKIVNYDRKIATGIVLVTPPDKRHFYHESNTDPYVDYSLTYKNITSKSIDVEMEVFVVLVSREKPDSPENYRKLNVRHYDFTLLPGQTKTVEDKLLWLKNENDIGGNFEMQENEMPRIVYPGKSTEDGIYLCSYTNDFSNRVYQENITNVNFSDSTISFNFQIFLEKILVLKNFKNDEFIKGIGEYSTINPDELKYVSSIQLDGETTTSVTIDNTQQISLIEVSFPNYFPEKEKMLAKFNEIKSIIDKHEGFSKKEEGTVGDNLWAVYSNDECDIYIETYQYEPININTIRLQFIF